MNEKDKMWGIGLLFVFLFLVGFYVGTKYAYSHVGFDDEVLEQTYQLGGKVMMGCSNSTNYQEIANEFLKLTNMIDNNMCSQKSDSNN